MIDPFEDDYISFSSDLRCPACDWLGGTGECEYDDHSEQYICPVCGNKCSG